MQNIGIMLTYNDDDIIEEVMNANKKFFDKILVLDGSTDKTEEILRSFNNVKLILKDHDLYPRRKVCDGTRQFLLEKAQELFGTDGWITILCGDEVFIEDPNEIAERAERAGAERVNWHSLSFFWHISQKEKGIDPAKPIIDQMVYYHPGVIEIRQYKNKPGIFYDLHQPHVTPYGLNWKPLFDFPIYKHFPLRSYKQIQKRPVAGTQAHRESDKAPPPRTEIFVEKLSPHFKQIRKFEGNYDEFDPKNRSNIFFQWLKWHQYINHAK